MSYGRQEVKAPRCLVSGCERLDVCHPTENLALCYGHYAELWDFLEVQDEAKRNHPENEEIIRAWVRSKQNLKKPETDVARSKTNG